jgi:hypothetical protein
MEKVKKWMAFQSGKILATFLSLMFMITISIKFFKFPMQNLTPIVAYLFWFSFGMYAGFSIAIAAVKYLRKESNYKKNE